MITNRKIAVSLTMLGLYIASTVTMFSGVGNLNSYDWQLIGITIHRSGPDNALSIMDFIPLLVFIHVLLCFAVAWILVTAIAYLINLKRET